MPWNWRDDVITSNAGKHTIVILMASIWVLSACSGLTKSDKPATTNWWLKPYNGATQQTTDEAVVPVALTVKAVPGLDSDQILTLSTDAQLKPYSGARWVDHAPELLASLLGRSMEASGPFEVLTQRSGWGAESCDLQLELREFYADLNSAGTTTGVRVAIDGRYLCDSASPVDIKSNAFVVVNDERMSVIVAAFQKAVDQVTQDMLDQLQAIP